MVNNAEKSADSYKGRMAQKYGIPIVSTSFVDVSVERGELVEPDDFLAVGKTAAEQFQTGKIIGTVICIVYVCYYIDVCIVLMYLYPNFCSKACRPVSLNSSGDYYREVVFTL